MSTLEKLPLRRADRTDRLRARLLPGQGPRRDQRRERIYYLGFVTGYRVHHYGHRTAYGERRRWKLAWSKPLQDDRGNSRRFAEKAEALAAAEAWVEARGPARRQPREAGTEVARFP